MEDSVKVNGVKKDVNGSNKDFELDGDTDSAFTPDESSLEHSRKSK